MKRIRSSPLWFSTLATFLCALAAYASFNPPSGVPYNAAAYAARAGLKNATGLTLLASYASPASCPVRVNLFSQNVTYTAPVLSLIGRAGLNLNLTLNYNSKVWVKSGTTIYFDGDKGSPAPGWRLGFGRIDGVYAGGDGYNHYYRISPDGSVHDLRFNSATRLYESTDSTYMDFNDSTGVLREKDGTQIAYALIGGAGGYVLPTTIKDRNGNYITINYTGSGQNISSIVDTVGRTVSFTYNADGTLATITKTGFGNVARTWTFAYANQTLSYSFSTSLTLNGPANGSQVKLLSSITYPDGTQTSFLYNGYAQLTEADLLSTNSTLRGKHLVTWQTAPVGGWTDSPAPSQVGNFDGTSTNYWSLAFNTYSTTVTDPTSVPRTTTFLQTGGWDDGLPNQTQIASPVLRTLANVWGNDGSLINPRITSATTLNDTGQQSQVQRDYTTYGNVTEMREYDYGLTTLLRKTHTTYVTDPNYISRHILNLPATVIVYDGSGTAKSNTAYTYDGGGLTSAAGASNHDDTNYGTTFLYRGLITLLTQYTDPVTPAGAITHSKSYDTAGNVRTEAADCCVQNQYNFSSATQYSQPDSIVHGSGSTTLTTSATYDSSTGLQASSTDENNQPTNYNYDVMDRMTSTTRPDGTVISTSYDDAAANPATTTTTPVTSTTSLKRITAFDGLGRKIRETIQDAAATVFTNVDTQYDSLGRVSQASLPYTGPSPLYWKQNQYDALGRLTKEIPPDGSPTSNNTSYSYSGNTITATDNAGKQRKEKMDALDRMIEMDEPDPASGNTLTLVTTYVFDPMGNNTQITQGAQTRSFVFDGLGRKTSETTPEAGTVNFVYNNYGLVTQRTDARGVVTTYSYDGLNRPYQISYATAGTIAAATSTVTYTYGTNPAVYNNGRLITMADGPGSENYSYDQLGRRTQVQKVMNNVTYTTSTTYNLAGEVVTMTYPSGRVVKQNYDTIGRLQSAQNNSTSANYVSGIAYNAANQVSGFTYGNNVAASFGYSAQRFQLSSLSYNKGTTTLFSVSYAYTQNGGNNGQVTSITDNVDAGRTVSYTFDSLHRLTGAVTTGSVGYPAWGLSWAYDRYGNRLSQTVTAGSGPSNTVTVSASTNRITGMGASSFFYDASGNLTQDDLYKYVYDAEHCLVQLKQLNDTVIATYTLDGNGLRVVKVVGTNRTYFLYEGTRLISEFTDTASTTYTAGATPAQAPSDSVSLLLCHHGDHLTTRLTTDNFATTASSQGHYPYGESWYDTGTASPSVTRKFTSYSKEAEADTGKLNYAVFREHSARIGRFNMTDPVQGTVSDGPQRLNRYAYVTSDPVNIADPNGTQPDAFRVIFRPPFSLCSPQPQFRIAVLIDGFGMPANSWCVGLIPPPLDFDDPTTCQGDGTRSKTRAGPPLCNKGDRFVEEWACPNACTVQECGPKATAYTLDCNKRGKPYYAVCSTYFTFTGATKYCHCCIQEKKTIWPSLSVGAFKAH